MYRMKLTTTSDIPGEDVFAILGVVHSTAVLSADAAWDLVASIKNFVGGKVSKYEKVFEEARDRALEQMIAKAQKLGANAIIGVNIDIKFNPMGKGALLAASASGTAVLSRKSDPAVPLPL
ncbi:YbjQ family protein [Candidatus Parcubacteria bacterium]|nr:MAG: YbjQ family protein [Candidatus Parcubacteria bacterium]